MAIQKPKSKKYFQNDVKWKDVKVGSIIRLYTGDIAPADMVVLDTSLLQNKEAICYIDTS